MSQLRTKMCVCLLVLSMFIVVGCQNNGKSEITTDDVITQKVIETGKIPITVLVKYAFSINNFEKIVEEKFPNIDIIQVGNYTSDMGIKEYAARMEHDDLTDIVMTWPLNVGESYWEDRLLDLSGMSFSSNYNTSILNSVSKNGKLYYLPGPSQIRGIVYNKTLFKEKGWKVPSSYEEFIKLCQDIEKNGIKALQLGFKNSEVLDTAFVGYNYGSTYSKPYDVRWIENYNQGNGEFKNHFSEAVDTFQDMIDAGIFKESDLDIDYSDREKLLFNRQCAMNEDSVLLARMGKDYNGTDDEFGLMPFFNKGDDGDWARLYMVCYIGLNKHLAEEKNKEKYDAVIELMEYISTPEGQEALASDTGAMFSSVKGSSSPDIPEIQDLIPTLNAGRYAIFPELKNAKNALRDGLAGLLRKEISKAQLMENVDVENSKPVIVQKPEVIGQAVSQFTLMETGQYITDVMKKETNSDIALFLDNGKDGLYNGKGVSGRIYAGDVTMDDIVRIMPDLKSGDKGLLTKVKMTGEQLIETLEKSVSVDNTEANWFYYFSGLKMEFNPTASQGKRVKKVILSNGDEINLKKEYSVAIMDGSVSEKLITSAEKTETSIRSLIIDNIRSDKTISPLKDERFKIISGS